MTLNNLTVKLSDAVDSVNADDAFITITPRSSPTRCSSTLSMDQIELN